MQDTVPSAEGVLQPDKSRGAAVPCFFLGGDAFRGIEGSKLKTPLHPIQVLYIIYTLIF